MKRAKNRLATVFFLLLFIFSLTGCGTSKFERYESEKFLFGTYIKIIIYAKDQKTADLGFEKAFNEIERIDKVYNSKSVDSIIYKLNNEKDYDKKTVVLDQEGVELFKSISEIYKESNGKFDITIAPFLDLWGFSNEESIPRVPTEKEIEEVKGYVGYDKVKLDGNRLEIESPIKAIDTGAFLKGYAIEKGKEKLKEYGIESGFITAISSISTIGVKADGKPWKVGIQNPEKPGENLGIIEISGESMGVSGDYQTFVEIDGKKYHHIIDKNTGYPITDKKLVVVIGDNGFKTDLLSTALFLMNEAEIKTFMEKNRDYKVLIVRSDMSILKSDNFKFIER